MAIVDILDAKELWIRKKTNDLKQFADPKIKLEDEVLLFGEIYSMDCIEVKDLKEKLLRVRLKSTKNVLKSYDDFYKDVSKIHIFSRLKYFSQLMNLSYLDVKFRKMKRRWGSCNSKKVLTFNIELMKINKELIDYVVVHELAHLKHMNHSRDFHALVESYLPSARSSIRKLKNTKIHSF